MSIPAHGDGSDRAPGIPLFRVGCPRSCDNRRAHAPGEKLPASSSGSEISGQLCHYGFIAAAPIMWAPLVSNLIPPRKTPAIKTSTALAGRLRMTPLRSVRAVCADGFGRRIAAEDPLMRVGTLSQPWCSWHPYSSRVRRRKRLR